MDVLPSSAVIFVAAVLAGPQQAPIPEPPPDSAELHGRARDAQRVFEHVRRRHLPRSLGGGGGPCDDRVGRMCWRHEPGGYWSPEPEDPEIGGAREELLHELAAVAEVIPGDGWVLGQRVFYMIEAGREEEALDLARRCGGVVAWWCAALQGLAFHVAGRFRAAEDAFTRALERMEPDRARRWRDVEVLIDGDVDDVLEDADESGEPGARAAVLDRLWRLADPLLLVESNDRRTEHWARRAVARIRSGAANPHGIAWGDDMEELLIRYGWGVGWERVNDPGPGSLHPGGSVVGHEHPESRSYLPPGDVLREPTAVEPGSWTPSLAYAPSAYAPAYAPVILPMDARVMVFPRGQASVVVARTYLPRDTTYRHRRDRRPEHRPPHAFAGRSPEAGLFMVPSSPEATDTVYRARSRGRARDVLRLEVPAGDYWVSVESWSPERGLAGRTRHGLVLPSVPPDVPALGALLLLEPGPEPASLEEALERLRLDERVESGGRVRVAWEVWGLGFREETLAYRFTLREPEGGFLRRAGRWLGLVDDERPQLLEWTEPAPDEVGPYLRSVLVDLPELDPGGYLLRLELDMVGRDPLVAERRIEVVEAGDPDRPPGI